MQLFDSECHVCAEYDLSAKPQQKGPHDVSISRSHLKMKNLDIEYPIFACACKYFFQMTSLATYINRGVM